VTTAHQNNDSTRIHNTVRQIQVTYKRQRTCYAMQNNNQAAEKYCPLEP